MTQESSIQPTATNTRNRFKLPEFVAACAQALDRSDGADTVIRLVTEAISDVEALTDGLPELTEDETLLHMCEKVTIFAIRLTPGLLYPPHNHFMPVVIGLYDGSETNFTYDEVGGMLLSTGKRELAAPSVHCLPRPAIHAVMNDGDDYSRALHVYCGDLANTKRNIWDLEKKEKMTFTEELYFKLSRDMKA
ncbi:MAG: hypothetical protein AAGC95_13125 [Pseudomonadota bacterium]